MKALLLRYLTPLTYIMWAGIIIGMIDNFFLEPRGLAFLPSGTFNWLLILMWPLVAAVWFGHKEAERQKALKRHDSAPEN